MARGPFKRPLCPSRGRHATFTVIRSKDKVRCNMCGRIFERTQTRPMPRFHTLPGDYDE